MKIANMVLKGTELIITKSVLMLQQGNEISMSHLENFIIKTDCDLFFTGCTIYGCEGSTKIVGRFPENRKHASINGCILVNCIIKRDNIYCANCNIQNSK